MKEENIQQKDIEQQLKTIYHIAKDNLSDDEASHVAAMRLWENREILQSGMGEWSKSAIDDLKDSVELLSGGTNTVLVDDRGLPSIMVHIPPIYLDQISDALPHMLHPVFRSNGKPVKNMYLSKFQNILVNGRAYSLPMRDPETTLQYMDAVRACSGKGNGWGLSPFGLRSALVLMSRKNGFMAHGNNDMEHDYYFPQEHGIATADGRVATGSGPVSWSHNGSYHGVWDLNGNLNEWDAGMRLVNGQIQLYPGCESLFQGEDNTLWRAVTPQGALVAPSTPGTLRYTGRPGKIQLTNADLPVTDAHIDCGFTEISAAAGLQVPDILLSYSLFPEEIGGDYGGGWRRVETKGDRRPLSGGASRAVDHSGVFMVCITIGPEEDYHLYGFRSAYAQL